LLVIGDQIIETPNVIAAALRKPAATQIIDRLYEAGRERVQRPSPCFWTPVRSDLKQPTPRITSRPTPQTSCAWADLSTVSATGNELGGIGCNDSAGDEFRVHFFKDVYYGSHIDSTL
jgi:hypothetical protein